MKTRHLTRYFRVTYTVQIDAPDLDNQVIIDALCATDPESCLFADIETALNGAFDDDPDITVCAASAHEEDHPTRDPDGEAARADADQP